MANETVLSYLDQYCERAGHSGLFAEPLNLFTNLFFIVGSVLAARAIAQVPPGQKRFDLWLLFLFMAAIGIGSGLWHAMPQQRTLLMDVVPIGLFINLYLISAMRRLLALSWSRIAGLWLAYTAVGIVAQKLLPADLLNGTIMYIPTYATLVLLTGFLWHQSRKDGLVFFVVLIVWSVSLIFRTIDMDICPQFHFGTHFLWHTLNAWVLWRLLMVLVKRASPSHLVAHR